ncbi:MAG: DNA polymerase III subunit epsilon [Pseudomonadota bacterium]|nr:DNA polymerase III subunit epsilon [Pseudomonadota bacterium]
MREIVLDTETTGLSPEDGDRIIEIGAIELINFIPSDKYFHAYINPQREISESALSVHGLTYDFLKDKPVFSAVADDFLEFVGTDSLVIHNAKFDINFLNHELQLAGKPVLDSNSIVDTLEMARKKFPGSPVSLDALCRRFSINNSERSLHGALLDSKILAKVYLELLGGRQPDLELGVSENLVIKNKGTEASYIAGLKKRKVALPNRVSDIEINRHKTFIAKIDGMEKWEIYKKI